MALSIDSPFVQTHWATELGITFPMLSDANREASRAFQVLLAEKAGVNGIANRCVYVIDRQGTIRYSWQAEPKELPDHALIVAALDALT